MSTSQLRILKSTRNINIATYTITSHKTTTNLFIDELAINNFIVVGLSVPILYSLYITSGNKFITACKAYKDYLMLKGPVDLIIVNAIGFSFFLNKGKEVITP